MGGWVVEEGGRGQTHEGKENTQRENVAAMTVANKRRRRRRQKAEKQEEVVRKERKEGRKE